MIRHLFIPLSQCNRYVLFISLLSRVTVLLLQFLANLIIEDHNADAYRNKYYLALDNNPNSTDNLNNSLKLPEFAIYRAIRGLTNWDSQYFLEITLDGYNHNHRHLAFLPLFPTIVAYFSRLIFLEWNTDQDLSPYLSYYIWTAFVGIGLNNFVFFPIASIILFNLTKRVVSNNDRYALQVIKWFCFNPASIFFSAYYSESLFATLGFTTMLLLETNIQKLNTSIKGNRKLENSKSQSQLALLQLYFPVLIIIGLCCITRSNGLVLLGYIYFHIMTQNGFLEYRLTMLSSPKLLIGKLINVSPIMLISTAIAAFPYVLFQLYSRHVICSTGNENQRSDCCDRIVYHPYGWIQEKYWNVGLFKYYSLKQVPNFLLATPLVLLIILNSSSKIKLWPSRQVPYYIHSVALTIFCVLCINVQVTTRLIASSCPVLYWICADLSQTSRSIRNVLILYFGTYFLLGTILHSNFYPWT